MVLRIPQASQQSGFNLVELMVVIAIFIILLSVAAPAFDSFFKSVRDDQVVGGLRDAMALARSEAIKSGRDAIVCAGRDDCTDATDWSSGWLVLLSDGGSGSSEVLQVWDAVPGGYQVNAVTELRFRASGETAAGLTQSIQVVHGDGNHCLYLGPLGNVSAVEGNCS